MEREALLSIILQDIKELETLVETFRGKNDIQQVYINLARSKAEGIIKEIDLLVGFKETVTITPRNEDKIPKTEDVTDKIPTPEIPPVAPPQEKIIEKVDTPLEIIEDTSESQQEKADIPKPVPLPEYPTTSASTAPKAKPESDSKGKTVLGETLVKDKKAINDLLSKPEIQDSKVQAPVSDLKKAIGINDRFLFIRELFGGDTQFFNDSIEKINTFTSFEEAKTYISTNFNWKEGSEAESHFMHLLKRRFTR